MPGFLPAFSAAIRLASPPDSERQKDHPMCYTAHGERTEDKIKQYDWDGDPRCKSRLDLLQPSSVWKIAPARLHAGATVLGKTLETSDVKLSEACVS